MIMCLFVYFTGWNYWRILLGPEVFSFGKLSVLLTNTFWSTCSIPITDTILIPVFSVSPFLHPSLMPRTPPIHLVSLYHSACQDTSSKLVHMLWDLLSLAPVTSPRVIPGVACSNFSLTNLTSRSTAGLVDTC